MLVLFYLYMVPGNSGLGTFIGVIDLIAFSMSMTSACIIYFSTDPEHNECLTRGPKYVAPLAHYIALFFLIVLVANQLFFNCGDVRRDSDAPFYLRHSNGVTRLVGYMKRPLLRIYHFLCVSQSSGKILRPVGIISTTVDKLFDRWALFLLADIAIWHRPEYADFRTIYGAFFGLMAAYLRSLAVLGFTDDCSKIFVGQFNGLRIADRLNHKGVVQFRELWSHQWMAEVALFMSFLGFYAKLFQYYLAGEFKLSAVVINYCNLLLLIVQIVILISLVNLLNVAKLHESDIRAFCDFFRKAGDEMKIVAKQSTTTGRTDVVNNPYAKASYADMYLYISHLFDVIKMLMFTQFMAIITASIPILEWAFPSFTANPISEMMFYIMGWATPLFYNAVASWFRNKRHVVKTIRARKITVTALVMLAFGCCATIGAYRGCDKVHELLKDGVIDLGTADSARSFLVYMAKASAIPTTFAFGTVFVTSPGAARFSASWSTLPFLLQITLSPMTWLTPHIMNELHVISGAIFFSGGVYHGLMWILVFSTRYLTEMTGGIAFALVSGVCMIFFAVKLLWPPGMSGIAKKYGDSKMFPVSNFIVKMLRIHVLDAFLKDSKYGSAHVYIANIVFFLYCFHASVNLYPMKIYYWTYPVICYLLLFFLHPAKSTIVGTFVEKFRSKDTFSRAYKLINREVEEVRGNTLAHVKLTLELPTYEAHFHEVYDLRQQGEYTGYCDVILVKLQGETGLWAETVHYYSVVGIEACPDTPLPTITCTLLIGATRRRKGCSATLAAKPSAVVDIENKEPSLETAVKEGRNVKVVGFVKSNALESLHIPCVIAFGWESGAAAFCSLFTRRKFYRNIGLSLVAGEKDTSNIDGARNSMARSSLTAADDANLSHSRDLMVIWAQFMRKEEPPTVEEAKKSMEDIARFQKVMYDRSGGPGTKLIFIITGFPSVFSIEAVDSHANMHIINGVHKAMDFAAPVHYSIHHFPASDTLTRNEAHSAYDASNSKNVELSPIREDSRDPDSIREVRSFRDSYNQGNPKNVLEHLLQQHANRDCWVPMMSFFYGLQTGISFAESLRKRVNGAIYSMHDGRGLKNDIFSFFITSVAKDKKDLLYTDLYDTLNRTVIEAQLRYQKDPRSVNREGKEPTGPNVQSVATHVLYSGDYSSTKLDQLRMVVEAVTEDQLKTEVPASLLYVPDA